MDPAEKRTLMMKQLARQLDEIETESQARIDAAFAPLQQTKNTMRLIFEGYMANRDSFPVESQDDFDIVFILHGQGLRFKVRLYREPLGDALFSEFQRALTRLGDIEFETDESTCPCASNLIIT
ncbi:unnamed protein product [Linum trigynum]|uniref:Kinetochore protein SPC25 n=1 Tax=Linum trigynum TaxID=586398 RepID=A0AAV2FDV6_9ROSI